MYFEFEFTLWLGFLPVPSYAEMGYYSNYYSVPWQNSGNLVSCAWTFFDCYDTLNSLVDFTSPNFLLFSHTNVWPAQLNSHVKVMFQAVDASGSQIDDVGFEVDGSWNFYSGLSYWLPDSTHSVYAANPGGALNWIDQDGHGLNGCPVSVTISGDTTITAHYYHWVQIQLGCVSSIADMAWSAALDFSSLSNYTLGDGNPADDYI